MSAYPDTSFLCAFYRLRTRSDAAVAFMARLVGPLRITTLLQFEFEQGVRAEIFRNDRDRSKGYGAGEGMAMLVDFDSDLRRGVIEIVPFDWPDVHKRATWLSEKHTIANGHRAFDILHVATALHLGARDFLTFDDRQRRLAEAEGLTVPL
jgi:predicted nucleic acid-binding protein